MVVKPFDFDRERGAEIIDLDALLNDVQREMELGLEHATTKASAAMAAARSQDSGDHEGLAQHLRGWARFGTGDVTDALQDQLAAMDLLTASENEEGVGRCVHAFGVIYDTIGEPSLALEHFERAIEIQVRVGDKWGEARTRNGLAILMSQAGQFDDAIAGFREVEARFEEVGDEWWVLMTRTNRCETQVDQAQADVLSPTAGRKLCEETLVECAEIIAAAAQLGESGRSVEIYTRHCRAGALLALGRPEESLAEVYVAMPKADRAGDATVLVDLELARVRSLEALGQPETVLERLDRAEDLARKSGRDRHLARCLELRTEVCEAHGDLQGALEAHRRFHELKARAGREAEEMRAKVIRSLLNAQQVEHQLALARSEVDKLEAIGRERRRMVSVIAHELRNPITTVLGLSSEMASRWDDLGAEAKPLIEMIRDEAEDIADIVEDLLATESLAQGSLRVETGPLQLGAIVSAVLARTDLDGKAARSCGDVTAMVDPVRFRQILRNLVSNAVRYGGDQVAVFLAESNGTAIVEVCDNGPGVPTEDRSMIFEPFRRSSKDDHSSGSVGLGLAVTRQLARLMDGDVAYDETDRGTVFRVTLPIAS